MQPLHATGGGSCSDWRLRYGMESIDDGELRSYWREPVRSRMKTGPVMSPNPSAGKNLDNGVSLQFGIAGALHEEPPVVSLDVVNTSANSARYSHDNPCGRRV